MRTRCTTYKINYLLLHWNYDPLILGAIQNRYREKFLWTLCYGRSAGSFSCCPQSVIFCFASYAPPC